MKRLSDLYAWLDASEDDHRTPPQRNEVADLLYALVLAFTLTMICGAVYLLAAT